MVQINLFNISKINGQNITGLKNHKDYKKYILNSRSK